ncbi:MAG: hypothetical protein R3182_10555 [Draconibacterium sp.]|nr:hypothetical protein [Draconibacterium sp.]
MNNTVSYDYKNTRESGNLWDSFIIYLEKIYFPGAIEALDGGLVAFEYENFKDFTLVEENNKNDIAV